MLISEKKQNDLIVKITEEERDTISDINEKLNSLTSLSRTLCEENVVYNENSDFYSRIVEDMNKARTEYNNWWKEISAKYNLQPDRLDKYYVNFISCGIYLL